jgi:hypothetical protein
MTGISLHVQWPLTFQSRGSFLKENNWFFITDQTSRPLSNLVFSTWGASATDVIFDDAKLLG